MQTRIEQTNLLDAEVTAVKFAHGKRLEGLHELGIFTVRNLIEYYPFRYDDFSKVLPIVALPLGAKNAVMGTIHEAKGRKTAKGGFVYEVSVVDNTGVLKAVWFNQKWLADTLTVGTSLLLLGKVEHQGGYPHMSSPLYTLVNTKQQDPDTTDHDAQLSQVNAGSAPVGIAPVYRATGKISSNWIKRLVFESRTLVLEPLDPLPPEIRIKRNLVSRQIAWYDIHTPATNEEYLQARRRLAYEQVFFAQLHFAYGDAQLQGTRKAFEHTTSGDLVQALGAQLPFELSPSQQAALDELFCDMRTSRRMNRLLLGDVGSGKTVVALHALVAAAESGWQAAMMAPTEVLVHQYVAAVAPFLDTLNISWTVLTSAVPAREKQEAYERIAGGAVSVVFGTHAILEPAVRFRELSLVVIDEQHRFGVEHRNSLIAKSPTADFLSMTATPIPRSLALVLYGNVTPSYLANRPQKATVKTTQVGSSVAYKAYEAVRKALERGEQAYIVCPLISAPAPADDEEEHYLDDLSTYFDGPSITAAEQELVHLRTQVFPERRIELLTSRVKSEEKQRIMSEFKSGEIDILVSTTVIEVGIDVPNATVMIILDADRFGLAQLHQLRGRVGRGTKDASVFLIAAKPGEKARQRLRILEQTSDGLALAKADLAERREGDIVGTRQHGESALSLVQVMRDSDLIEQAREDVELLLAQDPTLTNTEHQHLRFELLCSQNTESN